MMSITTRSVTRLLALALTFGCVWAPAARAGDALPLYLDSGAAPVAVPGGTSARVLRTTVPAGNDQQATDDMTTLGIGAEASIGIFQTPGVAAPQVVQSGPGVASFYIYTTRAIDGCFDLSVLLY